MAAHYEPASGGDAAEITTPEGTDAYVSALKALGATGFPINCWKNVSSAMKTFDSDGAETKRHSRKDSAHASTVWNVDDNTTAFKLETAHGFGWITMERTGIGCNDGRKSALFYHVHNQGGNGTWSASVGVAAFSLSYSGDSGQELQKATRIKYYDYTDPA